VEFLSDREVAAYGRYAGAPSAAELDRWFFLDDADKALISRRRGDHHRLGFALQLTTARFVGTFLSDPLDAPDEIVIYLAKQLDIDTIDQLSRYNERRSTRFEHQEEIPLGPPGERPCSSDIPARPWRELGGHHGNRSLQRSPQRGRRP
jgi:TnpA family transposase